jgi:hydrogenase small subunit
MADEIPQLTSFTSCGINRRDFMKLCTALAATMGLSSTAAAKMAQAVTQNKRPPVVWIGAQECTGCTESLCAQRIPPLKTWCWKPSRWSTTKY